MKKWNMWLLSLMVTMIVAPAAFAQGTGAAAGESHAALWIGASFGMGIAAFGCGLGQGKIGAAPVP
jgi:hypothetical protein